MEKWKKRAVNLLTSVVFGGEKMSVIPYYPQKIEISKVQGRDIPRSIPEAHGVSSKRIYNMLSELEGDGRCEIHNLMVLVGGEVISECSRPGYDLDTWHLSHSMTKSVTGMAVGLLYDDGLVTLDTRLVDVFPEISYRDRRFASITIEHLLTMTSGVTFGEAGSVTESMWSEAFFLSAMKCAPGSAFHYNSMNSYILSRVVSVLSGMGISEYVGERIFAPLGITNYFWEKSPEGFEKGGWGLYMSAESWAKLGLMFIGGGVYLGRRILSEEWINLSVKTHAVSPSYTGDFNYGYQMWVGRSEREYLFNGMLGQNVWMCPDNDIIVVMQSGNNELFQDSPSLSIVRRYLGGEIDDPISFSDVEMLRDKESSFMSTMDWVYPLDKRRGLLYALGIKAKEPFDERWCSLLSTFKFPENNSGILPTFVRAMQNNLESSIDEISFSREGDGLYLTVREREDVHKLEIGLYGYKSTVLSFRGERYMVRAVGEAETNPDGSSGYRVELIYPELPNTLMMRFKRTLCDRIAVSITENPNLGVVDSLATRLVDSRTSALMIMRMLEARFGVDVIRDKIERSFITDFVLADAGVEGYMDIVREQNEIAKYDSALVKTIKNVVNKYISYEEVEEAPGARLKNMLMTAVTKLKKKK